MLNAPNWHGVLPGKPYEGPEPDGFGSLADIIGYLETYAASFAAPVHFGARVATVDVDDHTGGYVVTLSDGGSYLARNVVVATGRMQSPVRPGMSRHLPTHVHQLHSSQYRNSAALPPGAVLVVGSSDSGCQIAED